jgi:hypothetical protein
MFLVRPVSAVPGAPGTPTLTVEVLGSSSIRLTAAATAAAGFKEWVFEYATAALGPFVPLSAQISPVLVVSPLSPSTTYHFRAKGTTNVDQVTAYSTTASGTTSPPVTTSIYRNWPSAYLNWSQGGSTGLTTTKKQAMAKCDVVVLREPGPAEYSGQVSDLSGILAIRSSVKLGVYIDPFFTYDNSESDSGHWRRWVWDVANTVTNWRLRNSSGGVLGHMFQWVDTKCTNMAVHLAGLDGAGKRFSQALATKYREIMSTPNRLAQCSVIPWDDYAVADECRSRSDGSSVSASYANNGVADDKHDDTSTGGGTKYRTGLAQFTADWRTEFPGMAIFVNLNSFKYVQGSPDTPILPLSASALYQIADVVLAENGLTYRARMGNHETQNNTHTYPLGTPEYGSSVGSQEYWADLYVKRAHARPDTSAVFGKQMVALYQQMACQSSTTPTAADYAFARMLLAHAMAVEGLGYAGLFNGADQPFWVDELAVKVGNPISTRSMGTLTEASPCSFTVRTADYTGGSSEKFFFVDFDNARWVFRWDTVGYTAGSSNFGDGSAVSCPLGSAGAGKRWDALNASTYAHPDYADLACVGQDTGVNNGATNITTVSLKPYHAQLVLRVNA